MIFAEISIEVGSLILVAITVIGSGLALYSRLIRVETKLDQLLLSVANIMSGKGPNCLVHTEKLNTLTHRVDVCENRLDHLDRTM